VKQALYLGLLIGVAAGLLVVVLFLLWLQASAPRPALPQPAAPAADVSLFLSELALSRAATGVLGQPAQIEAGPGGQLQVSTRLEIDGLEPVVHLGLALDRQENQVVSRLLWARVAFITLPVDWLPPELGELGRLPGQALTRQIPPQFMLVGLATDENGLTLQLNWQGP
jgi:hypothetical protein